MAFWKESAESLYNIEGYMMIEFINYCAYFKILQTKGLIKNSLENINEKNIWKKKNFKKVKKRSKHLYKYKKCGFKQ